MGFFKNPLKMHKKLLKADPLGKKIMGSSGKSNSGTGTGTGGLKQRMSNMAGVDRTEQGAMRPGQGPIARAKAAKLAAQKTGGNLPATVRPQKTGGNLPASVRTIPPMVAMRPGRRPGTKK
jgi:hypothetical protein